ncbi:MAG: acyl-CoA synthetase [Gammaproteobacteria bacterium]
MSLDLSAVSAPLLQSLQEIEAFEQTPLEENFPHTDSYTMLQQSATRFGDDPALEFLLTGQRDESPRSVSYRLLGERINATANLLHSLGLQPDQAVSIVLPILPETHFAIWGAQAAGIANPINPLLEAEHIGEIMHAAESRVVICLAPSAHADIWDKVTEAVRHAGKVEAIIAVEVPGLTSHVPDSVPDSDLRVLAYEQAMATQPSDRLLSQRRLNGDEIAAYFHTGGTTGRPKIAQLTHRNMAFLGQLIQVYTAHQDRQTILCGLPLFHIYGVIIQGIAAFSVGYRIVLLTPAGFRSPEAMKNFWHHIGRFRVKSFSTVPTVLMALSQIPVGDADISCLTNINSGAAPLSHSFELRFEQQFNVQVANGYGMTETTSLISRAPEYQPPGSVGMRLPYSRIRIAMVKGNRVEHNCADGESGVILVSGPQIFKGYKHAADNASAWTEDGWFNTGDLGYLDSDGFLYLTGRAKDLIIRGGHNIDPVLIEEPLNAHPAINTAVAVGEPDPYAGELPMVFIVPEAGQSLNVQELHDYCVEHISERAAIPKRFEVIDAMPLTAVGKIFRPRLRQLITEKVLTELLAGHDIDATVHCHLHKQRGLSADIEVTDPDDVERTRELVQNFTLPISVASAGQAEHARGLL